MLITLLLMFCSSMSLCMENQAVYGVSEMQGRRRTMEDAHHVELMGEATLFGLYDGHGGRAVADSAARNLHMHCNFGKCETPSDVKRVLEEGFLQTHKNLDAASYDTQLQGSTALVALIRNAQLFVANAGDSRAVLSKAGKAVALSVDHKPGSPDEKKRIEDLGGTVEIDYGVSEAPFIHCPISPLCALAVSRGLGDKGYHPYVIPNPDIQHKTLEPDDEFLILGCDGVWDVLENQEAVDFVQEELKKNSNNFEKAAQVLRDKAHWAQSSDNITVIVVDLKHFQKQ